MSEVVYSSWVSRCCRPLCWDVRVWLVPGDALRGMWWLTVTMCKSFLMLTWVVVIQCKRFSPHMYGECYRNTTVNFCWFWNRLNRVHVCYIDMLHPRHCIHFAQWSLQSVVVSQFYTITHLLKQTPVSVQRSSERQVYHEAYDTLCIGVLQFSVLMNYTFTVFNKLRKFCYHSSCSLCCVTWVVVVVQYARRESSNVWRIRPTWNWYFRHTVN